MSTDHIPLKYLINHSRQIVKPRILKSKTEQKKRSKDMAEVFTPAWVCNLQNNMIDNEWFGYKNAFNEEIESGWIDTEKVEFKDKHWKDYIYIFGKNGNHVWRGSIFNKQIRCCYWKRDTTIG